MYFKIDTLEFLKLPFRPTMSSISINFLWNKNKCLFSAAQFCTYILFMPQLIIKHIIKQNFGLYNIQFNSELNIFQLDDLQQF